MKATTTIILTDRRGIPDGTSAEHLCDRHFQERHPVASVRGRYLRNRFGRVVAEVVRTAGDAECSTCQLLTQSPYLTQIPF